MFFAFIVFSIFSYANNHLVFEILKDVSLTLTITFNFSFTFRIYKINVEDSFNNNKLVIYNGVSNHDESLAKLLDTPFEKIKRAIKKEESFVRNGFYSQMYNLSYAILRNFESPKYVFQLEELQAIFSSIKESLSLFVQMYNHYRSQIVQGEMAEKYIENRNKLNKLIDEFYLSLAKKSAKSE